MRIVAADLSDPRVLALVELHVRTAHEDSPPGSSFALNLSGLRDPALSLFTAWEGSGDSETLLGMGALRTLDAEAGELKSMRTAPDQLRRGVAAAMLTHLIEIARARGLNRLFLETGTNDAYAPARALYEGRGFRECGTFGDYTLTEFNRCYTLEL